MTLEECLAILGADAYDWIMERFGPPPPLSSEQIDLLTVLLDVPDVQDATAA